MGWFAVRSVYHFAEKSDGTNVFEERVVCFVADSFDEAMAKAERESERYAAVNGFEVHGDRVGYEQDGDPLIDGYEVWSEMAESRDPLAAYYETRYLRYDYHPE